MSYEKTNNKLDCLTEALKMILEEFERTKDAEVAAAGYVLSVLIVRHIEALDRQFDKMLDEAGL